MLRLSMVCPDSDTVQAFAGGELAPDERGMLLDHLLVIDHLGAGAMGVVVSVFGTFEDKVFAAMELCAGGTLADLPAVVRGGEGDRAVELAKQALVMMAPGERQSSTAGCARTAPDRRAARDADRLTRIALAPGQRDLG